MNQPRLLSLLDTEYHRLVLWNAVFFIFGILYYFSLSIEPSYRYVICIFAASLASLFLRKYGMLGALISSIIIAFCAGVLASKIRSENIHPIGLKNAVITELQGKIINIKHTVKGAQVTLDDVQFGELLMQDKDPRRVRVSVKSRDVKEIMIGDYVELTASLMPPPRSVLPGGYDFGLYAYFGEIGATGYSMGKIEVLEHNESSFKSFIQTIRKYLYYRLVHSIGSDEGNFAAALLLGEQGGLDRTIVQNMRFAGVSHVLCVSGMHLSLVAGIFFLCSRMLLNLSNWIAWHCNIKIIAAIIAIIGSGFYLMLSGVQIAATRAFIMTSLVMAAIMLSRTPFSRRSLSIAAIIILSLNPEYVLHPSFQLSFIAVLALIGGFEFYMKNRALLGNTKGLVGKFKMGFFSNIYSTLVAGGSTTPLVLYHFYIMSNYTILANMFVVPLITFIIMPLGVLAMFLVPLGLDHYVLILMGWFIRMIIELSDFVANTPGAVWYFGYISAASVIIYMIGLFWLMLWGSKLRLLGIPIIVISFVMMCFSPKPDVIFDSTAEILAARNAQSQLEIYGNHVSGFHQLYINNWFGQKYPIYIREDITAHDYKVTTASGKKVALLFNDLNCDADLVLNMLQSSGSCPNQLESSILDSVGAVLIFCDDNCCRAEYEKSKRFKFG